MNATVAAIVEALAGWLLTYALHGSVLALPALGLRWCGARASAWQEAVLRLCLYGPLLSSLLQCSLLEGPLGVMPAIAPARPLPAAAAPWPPSAVAPPGSPPLPVTAAVDPGAGVGWAELLVVLTAAAALAGLLTLARANWRLRRLLAGSRVETDARITAAFARALAGSGLARMPRLRRCPALRSPLVAGFLRPRVFVPDGIEALGDDELVALAAHELAHVRAADVLWLRLGALLQALFPWQLWLLPLRARLHLLAELRCDAEAARKIGATALARCLVEVAARRGPLPLALAPGMAGRPSALRLRVEAALAGHWGGNLPRVAAWLLPTLAVATLAAAAPGVRQADRRAGIPSPAVAHAPPPKPGAAGPAGFDAPELAALGAQCADLLAEAEAALAELAAAPQDEATQQLRRRLAAQVAALERAGARLEAALLRAGSRERRAGGPDGPARRTR